MADEHDPQTPHGSGDEVEIAALTPRFHEPGPPAGAPRLARLRSARRSGNGQRSC